MFLFINRNITDLLLCSFSSQTCATLETAGGINVLTVVSTGGRLRYLTKRSHHSLSEGIKLLCHDAASVSICAWGVTGQEKPNKSINDAKPH